MDTHPAGGFPLGESEHLVKTLSLKGSPSLNGDRCPHLTGTNGPSPSYSLRKKSAVCGGYLSSIDKEVSSIILDAA